MLWLFVISKIIDWFSENPMRLVYIIGGYLLLSFICGLIPRLGIACCSSFIGGPLAKITLEVIQHDYDYLDFLGEITWVKSFLIYILLAWLVMELFALPDTIENIKMNRARKKEKQPADAVSPDFIPDNRNPDYNYSFSYGYKVPIGFHSTANDKKIKQQER
mgnify:CR=1 FL=1|jgi:hypothetical protein